MNVASLLNDKTDNLITLKTSNNIKEAIDILSENKIGVIIIVNDKGNLQGILSERDIIRGIGEFGIDAMQSSTERLMTASVQTCTADSSIHSIMKRMTDGRFRHMPVMEDDNIIGMISIGDLVKSRMKQLENEADAMRDYIAG